MLLKLTNFNSRSSEFKAASSVRAPCGQLNLQHVKNNNDYGHDQYFKF